MSATLREQAEALIGSYRAHGVRLRYLAAKTGKHASTARRKHRVAQDEIAAKLAGLLAPAGPRLADAVAQEHATRAMLDHVRHFSTPGKEVETRAALQRSRDAILRELDFLETVPEGEIDG